MTPDVVTQYMIFRRIKDLGKSQKWGVLNKSANSILGRIEWYAQWRQYVFQPYPYTEFNCECLDTISDFLKRLNRDAQQ